jgi:ComF family protein
LIDIGLKIKQFFLPQQCLLCGAAAGATALCAGCQADLLWQDQAHACPRCGLPGPNGEVCGACLKHPPLFDATLAVLYYRYPVDAMLRRYKYQGLLAVAELLGDLLATRATAAPRPDVLVPMPLYRQRLHERGFNQAAEIARVAAGKLGLELDLQACQRTRPTPPQAGLKLRERVKNMRGAFACSTRLQGKHVALVDDIMTSGASLNELARTVKQAGAVRVDCWVVARTRLD